MLLCIVTHSLLNAKHTPVIQQFQEQNGILESRIIGHGTSSVCVLPSGVWLNDNFVSLATCKKFANQCLHKYMKGVEAVNKWFMFSTVWYSYSYWMGEVVEAAGEELTLKYVLCRTWCESNVIWAGAGLGWAGLGWGAKIRQSIKSLTSNIPLSRAGAGGLILV